MGQIDLASYKNIYLQTAKEYVEKMSVSLDKLSTNASDTEALNNLHIVSHSLKGQSQVMGYNDVVNICLNIEQISSDALKGKSQLNSDIIVSIKSSVEEIKEILKQVQNDSGNI